MNYNNLLEKLAKTEFSKTEYEIDGKKQLKLLEARNAVLIYKNMEGRQTDYNDIGKRNFCLVVTKEVADLLYSNGANVKVKDPENGESNPLYLVKVNVGIDQGVTPPEVKLFITKPDGRHVERNLDSTTIGILDKASIDLWAVECRVYRNAKKKTTSLYLSKLYASQTEVPVFGGMFDSVKADDIDLPFEDVVDEN